MMKIFKRIFAVFFPLLMVACGNRETPANKKDEEVIPEGSVKVSFRLMSFNILAIDGDVEGREWETVRKSACGQMLQETQPDILCVQECRREQLQYLRTVLPQHTFFQYAKDGVKASGYESVEECNDDAIFKNKGHRDVIAVRTDRFERLGWGRYWFSDTPDVSSYVGERFIQGGTPKLSLWLKLKEKESGMPFYVWDTHFFPNVESDDARLACAQMSVERMKAQCADNVPVFFCGDLNLKYENTALSPLKSWMQGARTTAKKTDGSPTYTGFRTNAATWVAIDHIFYRNASPALYKVVNTPIEGGTSVCSDHFPIYTDFNVYYVPEEN